MQHQLIFTQNPNFEDCEALLSGIREEAKAKKNLDPIVPFGFFIKGDDGEVLGGLTGNVIYKAIYVDLLWIKKEYRHLHWGTHLMHTVEKLAKDNECHFISLSTMDFEAEGFYIKLGYQKEFEREGYDQNSKMIYLIKRLKGEA